MRRIPPRFPFPSPGGLVTLIVFTIYGLLFWAVWPSEPVAKEPQRVEVSESRGVEFHVAP